MQGIDLEFYKGRSKYHTKFDTAPQLDNEARRSLWAMMDAARGSGVVLLDDPEYANHGHRKAGRAVYFDRKCFFFCSR